MFYHHDETNELIAYNVIDRNGINIIPVPNNSIYNRLDESLYKIKYSGYFDFEADENGLWLIYRVDFNNIVVAKIQESNYSSLVIEKKWHISLNRETTINLFISCGQLYALKQQSHSRHVTLSKICNLLNDENCSQNYEKNDSIILNSLTSQITFVQYNPDQKILSIVDGGNLLYYKLNIK